MFERPKSGERAVLVHITFPSVNESSDLREFNELALAAGAEPVCQILSSRKSPDPKYFIGTGKVDEIKTAILSQDAQLVIFNHELSPAQERNLEKALQCRVLSRTGLILDIFAQRARTFEGKLQVELAQLEHLSTRLVRGWTHLERQKGGIGLRGPGETQLESDRRMLRMRIGFIKQRLEKVKMTRAQSRRARMRQSIPTVALVGYTNAGKSTLFNLLTGADTFVANQLFATLDPTLRVLTLPEIGKVIVADTVGFVSHLPHGLVEAFRATLEEVSQSALLLHVVDAHDEKRSERMVQVNQVLKEISADTVPQILVFNKADLLSDSELSHVSQPIAQRDPAHIEKAKVAVSSITGFGITELLTSIRQALAQENVQGWVQLSANEGKMRALLYQQHAVVEELPLSEGGWKLKIKLSEMRWHQLCQSENGLLTKFETTK